ncbi:hypothetical protein NL676_004388 [Syzygium grande]|nr:hypothetical protein NL676_004388 [Syzygium grande]
MPDGGWPAGLLAVVRTGGGANSGHGCELLETCWTLAGDGKSGQQRRKQQKAARRVGELVGIARRCSNDSETGLDAKKVLWKSERDGQQTLEQKFDGMLMRSWARQARARQRPVVAAGRKPAAAQVCGQILR